MRHPGLRATGGLALFLWPAAIGLVCAVAPAAAAEGWGAGTTQWGWGRQQQVFDPDLFADYLLSGQPPHPAVARIIAPEQGGVSLGSGVLVDVNASQGLVLTNWHVIRDSRSAVLVQFPDGFQSAGTVVRSDEAWDLAAISIWKPPAEPVLLAARDAVPGEPLTIAGYGRGSFRAQTGRCTEYLSPGRGYPEELVELAAPARQGDSGGPILDADGRLAGVLFGEGAGRTVGSCVSRVRLFLASVGSDGYDAVVRPPAPDRTRLPSSAVANRPPPSGSRQRPLREPRIESAGLTRPPTPPPPDAARAPSPASAGQTTGPGWLAAGEIGIPAAVLAHFDVFANGRAVLTAAGGVSLVLLGLRLIWKSRQ